MNIVTLKIKDKSKEIEIPWRTDMNIQEALEIAYDQEKKAGRQFDFAVQYFGYFGQDYLGYLVVMIDKIYDNPNEPNDYWLFYVNGNLAQVGIDSYMANVGDVIEFDFLPLTSFLSDSSQLKTKKNFYSSK
ncbi:MAG: DUF4430 domain-containing protein [Chitinophagaceae bacterium]|uniref:DUF4430 domain-containing protein n=1 Tax=unclassified Paraflavitalea TaxID=2798305 RepID=UPI003D33463C|nr:DUF4430 domain-containing protein [Chitinophagaceae bacterium]